MVKKYNFLLGVILFLATCNFAFAQDPGNPDTVRVSSATATAFGQQVVINVTAYNDEAVAGILVPLRFSGQCVIPDSVSFVGTRVASAQLLPVDIDTIGQKMVFGAIYFSGFLSPGDGSIGKIFFTVKSGVAPETVIIDTFITESNYLSFVDTSSSPKEILPQFKAGAVYCNVPPIPVPHNPVLTIPGPKEVFGGQTLNFSVTATDVDTQDVLTITKSGVGTFNFVPKKTPATGFFSWSPTNADTIGSPYTDTFIVNDGTGLADTGIVEITVKPFIIPPSGLEGDLNGDGQVNLADIIYYSNFMFKNGPPPNPVAAGDIDGDCYTTLTDLIYLINYVFKDGPPPQIRCLPGDYNYDGYVNIPDIIFAINYVLKSGEPPRSLKSGDVNADCKLNIVDIVYLVDYIFRGGPIPKVGCVAVLASGRSNSPEIAQVGWGSVNSFKGRFLEIPIQADFNGNLAGVMFTVEFDPQVLKALEPQLTQRTQNQELFYSVKENQMTIGILDIRGQNYISGGSGALVNLRFENKTDLAPNLTSLRISSSELVNPQAQALQSRIVKGTVSPR